MSSSKKENAYNCSSCMTHREIEDRDIDVVRLNSALHELGMLSAITESRKQYLQEKAVASRRLSMGRLKETNPVCLKKPGFCVLHMNPNYVTDLSGALKCGLRTGSVQAVKVPGSDVVGRSEAIFSTKDEECCYERSRSRSSRYRLHFQKPYEVPWMTRLVKQEWPLPQLSLPQGEMVSAKDIGTLGNRSNPGSPEKTSSDSSSGLVRSRSLDDIEVMNPSVPSLGCQKSEIETVSQRMEGLHVN